MSTVTITAKTGPAVTVTSRAFTAPRSFSVDFAAKTMEVVDEVGKAWQYDVNAVSTVTVTAASGVFTIAVS